MSAASLSLRNVQGEFFEHLEFDLKNSWVSAVGLQLPSNSAIEIHAWLGAAPMVREWVGGRRANGQIAGGVNVPNLPYESTMIIKADELRRDKTGQLATRIRELAVQANLNWMHLTLHAIDIGATSICYDGQFFFDTDHLLWNEYGAVIGVQSNRLVRTSPTPTSPTASEFQSALLNAVAALIQFTDTAGELCNELARSFVVVVPANFVGPALQVLNVPAYMFKNGEVVEVTRSLGGYLFRLVGSPSLTWTDRFALLRADGITKPFIRQEEFLKFDQIGEGSETEFLQNEHLYGVVAHRAVAPGYWQHAVTTQFSL